MQTAMSVIGWRPMDWHVCPFWPTKMVSGGGEGGGGEGGGGLGGGGGEGEGRA